jgi:zeaxanthin glucosyltransferase
MGCFAFIAPPFPGHLNPMQVVAGTLIARGHRVVFPQQADARRAIYRSDIDFLPVGLQSHPPGDLDQTIGRINRMTGLAGMGAVLDDLARSTDMLCREAPAVLRDQQADAIIADQTEAAGGLIARHLGLPFVSMANALPINSEPDMPPPFTGWRYDPGDWGRQRNRGGYAVARLLMRPITTVIAKHAAQWRLPPLRTLEDCLSSDAQISQMISGFDFPRHALPPGFHYTGPLREPDESEFTPPARDRPLVFVSLGTLQGNRLELFRIIAEACAGLGLTCVITHGGRLSADQAASLPGEPLVADFLPQRAALRHAALVITHGGMNTILDALSFGVPMVTIPLAFEQAANAARLVHAGAGAMVKPRGLTAASLAAAIRKVMTVPAYRARAAALRGEIASSGGAALAAEIIEGVARS